MDSLLRLLLRLLIVPLGYVVGVLATMLVIVIGYWRVGSLLAGVEQVDILALMDALLTAVIALTVLVWVMWLIATIGILFAEAFAIRSWMFHVGNGALSAWLGAQMFGPIQGTPPVFDDDFYIVAAGLAGGLAYWLVAGWSAGFWKPIGTRHPAAPPRFPQPPPGSVTGP